MAQGQLCRQGGTVVAISASYYGAKDALSSSLGDAPVAARDAGSAFWELAFHAHEDMDADAIKAKAKTFANAVVQHELLRTLLLPDAQIYFRRDWQLPSAVPGGSPVPFRTTWSAGYCLEHHRTTPPTTSEEATTEPSRLTTMLWWGSLAVFAIGYWLS